MQVMSCACPVHAGQECGMKVVASQDLPPNILVGDVMVAPFCKLMRDPYPYIYSTLASTFTIRDIGDATEIELIPPNERSRLQKEWYIEFYRPTSHIDLKPLTEHKNPYPSDNKLGLAPFVKELVRVVDKVMWDALGVRLDKYERNELVRDCLKKYSIEEVLFVPLEKGDVSVMRWYYTTARPQFTRLKEISTMKEFATETTWRGDSYHTLRTLIPMAVKMLERALCCEDQVGKHSLYYSPTVLLNMVKGNTSGGILDADSFVYYKGGVKHKVRNGGPKSLLYEAAIREVHRVFYDIAMGYDVIYQPINVNKIKEEPRYMYTKTIEEISASMWRSREFYIPSFTLSLIAEFLHKERMHFERGKVITIGISGWFGGWYQLATILQWDNEELFWADGDVKSLDKHIPDFALYVYLMAGMRYWSWARFNRHQRTFLRRIYLLLAYHMVNKITLQPGQLWRLIMGVMYSGGPETSHGDSWIMAMIFFSYISYSTIKYPEYAHIINQCLILGFIAIIVYGDDHVWCCPKRLRHIINVRGFALFLKEFWYMDLRDYKEYDFLVSEVDIATGIFRKRGPKFLKRYFIKSFIPNSAPIIPYKETFEPVLRMCTVSNHEDFPGLLLKAIGQAWDSMGTLS